MDRCHWVQMSCFGRTKVGGATAGKSGVSWLSHIVLQARGCNNQELRLPQIFSEEWNATWLDQRPLGKAIEATPSLSSERSERSRKILALFGTRSRVFNQEVWAQGQKLDWSSENLRWRKKKEPYVQWVLLFVRQCVCVWPICSVMEAITLSHHRWQPRGAPAPAGGTWGEKQPSKRWEWWHGRAAAEPPSRSPLCLTALVCVVMALLR